jgi:hypothetical protein
MATSYYQLSDSNTYPGRSSSSSSSEDNNQHVNVQNLKANSTIRSTVTSSRAFTVTVTIAASALLLFFTFDWHSSIYIPDSFRLYDKGTKKDSVTTVTDQPSFIFILPDDMGYNSLSTDVTPFLMSLSDQGVKMERYYTQEVCTPARTALLTGRYPLSG